MARFSYCVAVLRLTHAVDLMLCRMYNCTLYHGPRYTEGRDYTRVEKNAQINVCYRPIP